MDVAVDMVTGLVTDMVAIRSQLVLVKLQKRDAPSGSQGLTNGSGG
jgi:hypothetical protein